MSLTRLDAFPMPDTTELLRQFQHVVVWLDSKGTHLQLDVIGLIWWGLDC